MSIKATYTDSKGVVKGSTVRLSRIWGSKDEGWSAWVNVYKKIKEEPITTFSINTKYVEGQNPYEALYNEASKLSFLTNITHDNIDVKDAEIIEVVSEKIGNKSPKK